MSTLAYRHSGGRILVISLLIFGFSSTGSSVLAQPSTAPYVVDLDEVNWGPPGGGNGSPLWVRTAQQGFDSATGGGITYYAMFPAGSHFDLHWYSFDEFVVVSGAVTLELGDSTQRSRLVAIS